MSFFSLPKASLVVVFALSAGALAAAGQPSATDPRTSPDAYLVRSWTTENGLPVNHILRITQTSDGYLWLSTGGGLVRFDGITFKVFTREDIPGWETSFISNLFEDCEGRLWSGSRLGEIAYLEHGAWVALPDPSYLPASGRRRSPEASASCEQEVKDPGGHGPGEDAGGAIWMTTQQGLRRLQDGRITVFDASLPDSSAPHLYVDPQGRPWAGIETGLYRFADSTFVPLSAPEWPPEARVRSWHTSKHDNLWLVTDDGRLLEFDGRALRTHDLSLPASDGAVTLHEDREGILWLRGSFGLGRWDGRALETWTHPDLEENLQIREDSEGRIWLFNDRQKLITFHKGVFTTIDLTAHLDFNAFTPAFQEDAEGNLWFGTSGGLLCLTPRRLQAYTEQQGLQEGLVMPIYEDGSGSVWIGTWGGGLHRLKDGEIRVYDTRHGLVSRHVRALHEDHRGRLWIGTERGLSVFHPNQTIQTAVTDHNVLAIREDRQGNLWVGGHGFLLLGSADARNPAFAEATPPGVKWLDNAVSSIHEDRAGNLWFATTHGLLRLKEGQWRLYTTRDGLSSNFVVSIYEERNGALWFGTHGGGINRLLEGRFFVYTTGDGLHNNGVWQILEDDAGYFWMSSDAGLFRVSRQELYDFAEGRIKQLTSVVFTEADGMPSAECNRAEPGGWKARDGRLWFPTIKGAVVVDPQTLTLNDRPPPVHIENVLADGQAVPLDAARELAPGARNVEIHYTALSFVAPEKNRFRYRLEGHDTYWTEAGARRTAFYTNLPPGTYTFRVIAANNDGLWNETGASLTFRVAPFFYETVWFYLLCLAVVGVLGAAAYRARIQHLRGKELARQVEERTRSLQEEKQKTGQQAALLAEQAHRLLEMDQVKRRFFANVSHEFRTPLLLIRGPLQDTLTEGNGMFDPRARRQLELALQNTHRLERLVDELLDLSRLESDAMQLRLQEGDLAGFVQDLVRAHAPLAERKRLALHFFSDADALPWRFDAGKIGKALGNLLSNAIKFTPEGGRIQVSVAHSERQVSISVRDSGIGIPEEALPRIFERFYQVDGSAARVHGGSGLGLALARELALLHGGDISVASKPGFGSRFVLQLPWIEPAAAEAVEAETPIPEVQVLPDVEGDPAPPAPEDEKEQTPEDAPTVLVVEDNADVRAYLCSHLQSSFRVVEAGNGNEALQCVDRYTPDLIVSDIMMPGMDGMELCRKLKTHAQYNTIPVILLTARAGEADRLEGLQQGADDYIQKPFRVDELQARIHNLIHNRRQLRNQFSRRITLQPGDMDITSEDEAFLEKARAVVAAHIGDSTFNVEVFSQEIGMSKSQLGRRLRQASGMTPAVFVRRLRLQYAARLLEANACIVSEAAYAAGFLDVDHFSKLFRAEFGVSPSEYRAKHA